MLDSAFWLRIAARRGSRNLASRALSPLIVGKEDAEAEGEGDEEAHVGEEEPREVLCDRREHLDVDAEGGEAPDHQHQVHPHQEHAHGRRVVLPAGYQIVLGAIVLMEKMDEILCLWQHSNLQLVFL